MRVPAFLDIYLLRAPATLALLSLCVAAYVVQVFSGADWWDAAPADLLRLGANYGPAVAAGEGWRVLTGIVLHGGLLHLALNMLALADLGTAVERRFGPARTVAVFVACGLAGSLASIARPAGSISVGASGAIFGLFGVWLLAVARHDSATPAVLRRRKAALALYAAAALGSGFLIPGVDNAAHVGGFAAGLLFGVLLAGEGGRSTRPFWPVAVVLAAVVVGGAQSLPSEWALPYVEGRRFDRVYRDFALADARINDALRELGRESRAGRLADSVALERIDKEVLPALVQQRQRWQREHFADPSVEKERLLWVRYAELRLDGIASLRVAMRTGDRRLVARFEARMAAARALVESLRNGRQAAASTGS